MKRTIHILATLFLLATAAPVLQARTAPRIEQVHSDDADVTGGKGTIAMTAAEGDLTFSIYSITGQLVRTVKVSAGTRVTVDVPRGFYIVKCSRWSRKVVVK